MQLKIKTQELQDTLSRAIKGASYNKMIPITSFLAIELEEGNLTLTTTDASNTLKVSKKGVEGDYFYVVVHADIFSKLVAKTTSENITLTLKENSLQVKGNGTYSIELPTDENGELIKFPEYTFDTSIEKGELKLSTVKTILTANKAALAASYELPFLTSYYFYDKGILTTDSFRVCGVNIPVFDTQTLLPAEMVNLLALSRDETIYVQKDKNKILFTTSDITIYGTESSDIENYPVEAIEAYLETEFNSVCKLSKDTFLNVLDRLMLFVSPYDRNGVYLTFADDGVILSSKKSNSTETIKFQEVENLKPYTCTVDIELLQSQIKANQTDIIELWYGHDRAIKMTSEKITQIVALLIDEKEI